MNDAKRNLKGVNFSFSVDLEIHIAEYYRENIRYINEDCNKHQLCLLSSNIHEDRYQKLVLILMPPDQNYVEHIVIGMSANFVFMQCTMFIFVMNR